MTSKAHAVLSIMTGVLAAPLVFWVAESWMGRLIVGSAPAGYRGTVAATILVVVLMAFWLYQRQRTRAATARAVSVTEREQLFHTLFEQSADANLLLDQERLFDCNAATLQLMRATDKQQVLSRQPSELSLEFQPDGRRSVEKAQEIITAAFREGRQRFKWVHRRLDGTEFWVEVLLTVIPWRDQHILHTTWRDITQRKNAEAALRASEARFRDLSSLASDWFWEQDDQFRFTYFSSGSAMTGLERTGIDSSRLIGKTRWEMPIVNLTPEQWAAHRAVLDTHQPFRDLEYLVRSDSGEERWFSISGIPLFDDAGRFTSYRGAGRDITEQQQDKQRIQALAYYDALTESTLLETGVQTLDTLQALQKLGIGLAIDDFGTGYSSLGYLKRLPITALKIDQSFVRDLENDPDDRTLAATIVALGHSLGLKVIAEGVETEQQRRILLEQSCDLAQGYLFSRPLPAEDFAAWLTRQPSIAASLHREYALVSD